MQHPGQHGLDGVERAIHVDGEVSVPQLVADVLKQRLSRHTSVVHQQRHGTEGVLHLPHHVVDLLPDGHVGLHGHGPLSRRRQLLHQRVSTVLPFPIVDADGVARRCQLPHRGASDAAGGARHQCDLFHVAPSPCVVLLPV